MVNVDSYDEENRLAKKVAENPMFPIGIAGCIIACGVGAYKFKNRGTMSTSVFLMQLRVAAQGTVVASLTAGLAYMMAKQHLFNKKD